MIYLITHGDRTNGPDPVHTKEGIAQIENLACPEGINLIVSGTGKRFLQILEIIRKKLPEVPIKYSPFCGGPEGFEGDDQVVLTDGRVINYHTELPGGIKWPRGYVAIHSKLAR